MSWFSAVGTSSTRSNNPNFTDSAREQRRLALEAKRVELKNKAEARKASKSVSNSPQSSNMSQGAAAAALAAQQAQAAAALGIPSRQRGVDGPVIMAH